ncbi:MAG: AraC family transcriptional regulator [Bacteroidaceae bacterium]|nr:AraC family transcriptional regulator [Bacteroidaceae bacterium]
MSKTPKLMDARRMQDILTAQADTMGHSFFINNELGIVYGDARVFRLVVKQRPPFIINDHRLGIFVRGEADINFNLQDRHITPGTLIYIGPGTIINPIRLSSDIEVYGIGLFADFPMPFAPGHWPSAFNGQVRDFQIHVAPEDITTARNIIDTLWHIVRQPDYHRPTVSATVAALMHHYDEAYRRNIADQAMVHTQKQTIFDRFISLVNQHCREQHQIAYYARRICLTERYLSTVIRQASGITAKDWIDRALVTRIKIELRHTDKPLTQISDEMGFPNPSFFSKYFRRLTGQTALDYRRGQEIKRE